MQALQTHIKKANNNSPYLNQFDPHAVEIAPNQKRTYSHKKDNQLALHGRGDGYCWAQTDEDLTIAVPIPAGSGKHEVALIMEPRFGPARKLALRARFWPQPLLLGELHAAVEASECMWHLSADGNVVIDCPKIDVALWPTPFAPPLSLEHTQGNVEPVESVPIAGRLSEGEVSVPAMVQRLGQRPQELDVLNQCCASLLSFAQNDIVETSHDSEHIESPSHVIEMCNARVVPILIRGLRLHGHRRQVQSNVWQLLMAMMGGRTFVKKLISDTGAVDQLLKPAISANLDDEEITLLLLLALRALLPICNPKNFVLDGGILLIGEAITKYSKSDVVVQVGCEILAMLSSLNTTCRTTIIGMHILPTIFDVLTDGMHEPFGALIAQLSRVEDKKMRSALMEQAPLARVCQLASIISPSAPEALVYVSRALHMYMSDAPHACTFYESGAANALACACKLQETHSMLRDEVSCTLEAAMLILSEATSKPAPEDADMTTLLDAIGEFVLEARPTCDDAVPERGEE